MEALGPAEGLLALCISSRRASYDGLVNRMERPVCCLIPHTMVSSRVRERASEYCPTILFVGRLLPCGRVVVLSINIQDNLPRTAYTKKSWISNIRVGGCSCDSCLCHCCTDYCASDQKCASYDELLIRVYVFQNRWSSEKIDRPSVEVLGAEWSTEGRLTTARVVGDSLSIDLVL